MKFDLSDLIEERKEPSWPKSQFLSQIFYIVNKPGIYMSPTPFKAIAPAFLPRPI